MTNIALNKNKQLATIGLLIAMASIVMLFGTFVSSFYVLKIRLMDYLDLPKIIIQIGLINTAILLISSATFSIAANRFKQNILNSFSLWLLLTIGGGFLFLIGQLYLWNEMTTMGIAVSDGQLSDMFYLISGAHGLHIISGLISLIWLQSNVNKQLSYNHVLHVGIFWHFLDFLWVVLFAVILF
jgi:cytochrome c oxidase subunit 3